VTEGPFLSPSQIVDVASGAAYDIALREDGKVWGWGKAKPLGLRGDNILIPIVLQGIDEVDQVAAARDFSLFLIDGQLTTINFYNNNKITQFDQLDQIVQAVGDWENIAVRRSDGTVWMLGENDYGQLGNNRTEPVTAFIKVPIDNVIHIAMHNFTVVAVKEDGSVWRWGLPSVRNADDYYLKPSSPQQIPDFRNVIDVSLSHGILAIHANGSTSVMLDYETSLRSLSVPVPVVHSEGGLGGYGYLLGRDGTLWGTGWAFEELGIGLTPTQPFGDGFPATTVRVLVSNIIDVSVGYSTTLALDKDGTVWSWGYGVIANGKFQAYQQPVPFPVLRSP
jgi:alpha-tubulin suppressor-like RCC1 family protein